MALGLWTRSEVEGAMQEAVTQDFPARLMLFGGKDGKGIIPIDSTTIKVGQPFYTYPIITMVGQAKIYTGLSSDIPRINAFVEDRTGVVRHYTIGLDYTLFQKQTDQFSGANRLDYLMSGCYEFLIEQLDFCGYLGEPSYNLQGLLGHPNVTSFTLVADGNENGFVNTSQWAGKTAEQVYRDLYTFASTMRVASKGVYSPQIIGVPQLQYDQISAMPMVIGGNAVNSTVKRFFLDNQRDSGQGVQDIVPMPFLQGQGAGGTDLMVAFTPNKNWVKFHVPVMFATDSPRQAALATSTECYSSTGGVQVTKPMSMKYAPGI